MADRRLMTIVQISDLYFGKPERNSGDAALTARVKDWWGVLRIFEGYLGHHGTALKQLEIEFRRLKDEEGAILVVTGDLSSIGHPDEYAAATDFIAGRLSLPSGQTVGLGVANEAHDSTIPGNHDHWPGNGGPAPMFGDPTVAFGITFKKTPWKSATIALNGKIGLRLMGIDTDAEVPSVGPSRLFGRGRFVKELEKLAGTLVSLPPENEVRVLLLHHSLQNQRYELGIHPKSRAALETFIKDREISVLLPGHTHDSKCQTTPYSNKMSSWILLEARCGTTTQRDVLPHGWKPRNPPLSPNSLLVHRIYSNDAGELLWKTNLYERVSAGFQNRGKTGETRLWPR